MKSPKVYLLILTTWGCLLVLAVPTLFAEVHVGWEHGPISSALVALLAVFIGYFWLNGTKDVVYTLYYQLSLSRRLPHLVPPAHLASGRHPVVVMVYCTCDDFNPSSLLASMCQDYDNYRVAILDDSRCPESIEAIDRFARRYAIDVIRRADRNGFKAGNLNNYLQNLAFDYFVVLDSDEIIPPHFILRSLDYFARPEVGIVQANHHAVGADNRFMEKYGPGVGAHWPAYQSVKERYGFLSLLGHGAMVSRECYRAAGGFPHVVAEDLAFSIQARAQGYYTVFASDILCGEEFPVSYLAFKKRHLKWTKGNIEFIRKFSYIMLTSSMTWFEKLDIVLFTYSLPLTALFFSYILIAVVFLPLLGIQMHYPLWMLVPTMVFFVAPMGNDILTYGKAGHYGAILSYCFHCFALYGSMLYTSVKASAFSVFGKPEFLVTPKQTGRITWGHAVQVNAQEMAFGALLLFVAWLVGGSVVPCLFIALAALTAPYLTMLSNKDLNGRHLHQHSQRGVCPPEAKFHRMPYHWWRPAGLHVPVGPIVALDQSQATASVRHDTLRPTVATAADGF